MSARCRETQHRTHAVTRDDDGGVLRLHMLAAPAAAQLQGQARERLAEHAKADLILAEDRERFRAQVRASAHALGRNDRAATGHAVRRKAAQAIGLVEVDSGRLQHADILRHAGAVR